MTWASLRAVQTATKLEFTSELAALHHFVQLPNSRWTRTLGPPSPMCEHVRGRVWRRK